MSDTEFEEKNAKHPSDEQMAAMNSIKNYAAAQAKREEHGIELLEQITKQLDSIEQLLRERLSLKQ